jgi:5-methylcytosine-specific restriction endonuclease McrA
MSKFTNLRDEYFEKIRKSGMREFSIDSFAYFMKKHGFEKVCLYCGGELPKRRRSYCCDLCKINFYTIFRDAHSWQHVRAEYIKKHPKCERCGKKAVEVHHKTPIRKYRNIGIQGDVFDEDNLESCCKKCHLEAAKELAKELEEIKYIKSRKEKPLDEFIG